MFSTTTRRASLVEHELLTLLEHLSSPPDINGIRVARSLVLCTVFCKSVVALLSFFFLLLCYLYFFDLRLLITPLVLSVCFWVTTSDSPLVLSVCLWFTTSDYPFGIVCLSLIYDFWLPIWYCLSVFDLRLLITPWYCLSVFELRLLITPWYCLSVFELRLLITPLVF
jgi:hypothetical protein